MSCDHCKDDSVLECPTCRKDQVIGSSGESYIIKCCKCRQKRPVGKEIRPIGIPWGGDVPFDGR